LQCVAVCVWGVIAVRCSVLQCAYGVSLQCVAVCCSVRMGCHIVGVL